MQLFLIIMNKIPVLILLIISAIFMITGDYFAKYWSINQKVIFFIIAFLTYSIAGIFYIPTLLREGLVITSVIWTVICSAGFLIVGLIIFKEHLTTWQTIGVMLGVISVFILAYFD